MPPDKRPPAGRGRLWLLAAAMGVPAVTGAIIVAVHRSHRPVTVVTSPAPTPSLPPAEQSLRDTLARFPRDPDAHRALARYLLDQHRPFEALWHFRAAQDLDPTDSDTSIAGARALAQAGFPDRAVPLLRARLARSPANLDARRALAEMSLARARPREALVALAGVGAGLATSAPAQLLLGDARAAAGVAAGARVAYQRAVTLEPEGAAGHDRLGRLALARAAWAEAKREFSAARERAPGEPAYGYRLGQAYWAAGERAEAEQLWREVARSSPGYAPVQLALGKVYQHRGDLTTAAQYLVAAVNADPASREAQFTLAAVMTALGKRASAAYQEGIYYLDTDRPHRAVQAFRRMTALAPERADGPRWVSLAYIQMKRLDLAAVEAQRGLERHPRDPQLLAQLGLLHVLGRSRPKAAQLCHEWLKHDPNAAEPHRILGRIAREEQRLPEALRYGEQALARDPQNALVCGDLSKTLAAIGGPENSRRAIELARRAVALNPREADAWLQLGTLLQSAGDPAGAADALLRALDLDPTAEAACGELVQNATREGRPESARLYAALATEIQNNQRASAMLWDATYRRPGDPAAHERLARSLLAAGDLRRASYQLQEIVTLRPGDDSARRHLALVQQLMDLQSG